MIGFSPGRKIGSNFIYFWADLIKVLPFAFVLIGLFEVWISRETVERHLGAESGAGNCEMGQWVAWACKARPRKMTTKPKCRPVCA